MHRLNRKNAYLVTLVIFDPKTRYILWILEIKITTLSFSLFFLFVVVSLFFFFLDALCVCLNRVLVTTRLYSEHTESRTSPLASHLSTP